MSAASENRYRRFVRRQADAAMPSHNDQFIADLNASPKDAGAVRPFDRIVFVRSHGGWFAECQTTGFGYWYKTIRQAVAAWRVVVSIDNGRIIGDPA